MMLIFGLMLLLLQTAACLEFNCRFNQSDPCYAALGHKLNLLMVNTSKYDLKIHKRINNNQDDPVCRVKNDKIKENQCDLFNNRAEVTVINGTLIINRVIRADSGIYTLRLDRSNGTVTSADLQVNVEAPIGSVEVSISCSSNGVKSVSCSSDGDQLIYSWTLNGESLMDGNTTIQMNEETDGNIICSVKNHISHRQKSIRVKHCPVFSSIPPPPCLLTFTRGLLHKAGFSFYPAPIGLVEVSINCSSNGMKSVSCSSDGDQLIYSWTLNGESLMDGNTTIQLNETDGNIICSVKNHVSHRQKNISVQHCPESVVFVLVWSFQMMVLFGLLGGFHIYMRHTSGKKQEDQKVRMRRFREGHEHTAEDS